MKSPDKIAGFLSLLGALLSIISWYILLFVALPERASPLQSAISQLQYTFSSQNPNQFWFIWFALLPVCGIAIGAGYLANLAKTKLGAVILLLLSCALGVSTLLLGKLGMAIFVLLPTFWGWRCVVRSNPSFKRDA